MKLYKKSLIVSSLFLAAYFGEIAVNIACGPEMDPYDNQTSYFLPNIEAGSYSAFQYIPYRFLYSEEEPQSEAVINIREWTDYLGKSVKPEDVQALMYKADSASVVSFLAATDQKQLPDSLSGNTFAIKLLEPKSVAAKEYFSLTKEAENLTFVPYNYWDPAPVDYSSILDIAEKAEEKIETFPANSFLRLRYSYQAARLYLYAKEYDKSILIYEKYIAPVKSKSALMGWALSNYAGAKRWNGEKAEAAFLYAKVFYSNPERRVLAYKNFHYIDIPDEEVTALSKTKQDQISLAALLGFSASDMTMEYLRTCYTLDHNNEVVGMLLTREVNKLESALITPYSLNWTYYNPFGSPEEQEKSQKHAHELRDFALQLSGKQKSLGLLTAAYTSWLINENEAAQGYLKKINVKKLPEPILDQFRITDMLTQLTDWKKGREVNEDKMVSTLDWLSEKSKGEQRKENDQYYYGYEGSPYSLIGKNILSNILVPQYLAKGDTALASLAALKADIFSNNNYVQDTLEKNFNYSTDIFWKKYLTSSSIIEIQNYLQNPEQQKGIVKYLLQGISNTDQMAITELLGTTYLRTHDYENAVKTLEKLPNTYTYQSYNDWYSDQTVYANPFITMNNDYPKERGTDVFDKLDFARQMLQLEKKLKTEKDPQKQANIYFMMANGVYQTSTFGNGWMLISYNWSCYDPYTAPEVDWEYDYLQGRQAKRWYEKARTLSKDNEFKARCTFMLAKCQQKEFQYSNEERWKYYEFFSQSPFYLYSFNNPYFKELKNNYSNTQYYQIAVNECSYLRDFIN